MRCIIYGPLWLRIAFCRSLVGRVNYIFTLAWGFPALLVSTYRAMREPLHVERVTRGSTFFAYVSQILTFNLPRKPAAFSLILKLLVYIFYSYSDTSEHKQYENLCTLLYAMMHTKGFSRLYNFLNQPDLKFLQKSKELLASSAKQNR